MTSILHRLSKNRKSLFIVGLLLLLAVLAIAVFRYSGAVTDEPPPRLTGEFNGEVGESTIQLPVGADLTGLSRNLEREIPKLLWSIDQADQVCVAPQTIDILIAKVKTPTIKCRIVGEVRRGALRLTGDGKDIIVTMPVSAVVRAKDVGGVLKQETAEARAAVTIKLRLDISSEWKASGTADIVYKWADAPHIDFLGQKIDLTEPADAKLAPVIANLEASLPAELAKLPLRQEAAKAWASAFTVLNLNAANPPVWMRITPLGINYSGYTIENGRLNLNLGLTARTETFAGSKPANPQPTALRRLVKTGDGGQEFGLNIPVIAEYSALEPVLSRALIRRQMRPFDIPGIGPVMAKFGKVTIYATTNDKIAVGLAFTAALEDGARSSGTVWLTARPVNQTNSVKVGFADLEVTGVTDAVSADLLIAIVNTTAISELVTAELGQNFEKDFADLRAKIDAALASKQSGNFVISTKITKVETGKLNVTPAGLYLPVTVKGTATAKLLN